MPRLVRNPLTWLIYVQLSMYAYFLYSLGPIVGFLRDEQGTSNALASLHSTALAIGAMSGGALFARIARRIGRGWVMWAALGLIATAILTLITLPSWYPLTLLLVGIIGFGGMWIVNCVVTMLPLMHGAAGSSAISEANAFAVGAGMISPLIIGATVDAGLGWRAGLSVVIGLIAVVAVLAWRLRITPPEAIARPAPTSMDHGSAPLADPAATALSTDPAVLHADAPAAAMSTDPAKPHADATSPAVAKPPLPLAYWFTWTMLVFTGAVEICLSLWSAIVLRERLDFTPAAASAAVSAMVGGMLVGRLVGARLALRHPPIPLYLGALMVSIAGFGVFWLAPGGAAAIVGLFVVGLGNAMHYPLAIAMAIGFAGAQSDRAAGVSSYGLGISFGIAPFVLGLLADWAGAHKALLMVPVLLAGAGLLAWRLSGLPGAPKVGNRPAEVMEQLA